MTVGYDKKLARSLVLDELFDLTLYKRLQPFARGPIVDVLEELISIETKHLAFWQDFFNVRITRLDVLRRIKLVGLVLFCRIFGTRGIHLVLEAIEVHGIKKYLAVWEFYKDDPLGAAVKGVLVEEFKHEDEIVLESVKQKIHPERIRDIFLGFNDGLVEILGAVSGFFAAFQTTSSVLVAGFTVAVAGSISMAAGAFVAMGSEKEVEDTEVRKKKFLGEGVEESNGVRPLGSAFVVGISYFIGAMVPVLPVLFGAQNLTISVIAAIVVIIIVSYLLAFLSGMDVKKRIVTNLIIIIFAVVVTYSIGIAAKTIWGISI
mgnify:CR=1 FL=1|jgi:VIT1/CCC1 family predicted Fe2+/Mn2+ transporter|tara:strand:+ start:10310 stop:11263 length:954 start_codon:yes stop_codon:yes gene_type:complete